MIHTIGTHNGRFHSDDLFSVALLTHLFPEAQVVRSRDTAVLDTCDIVLDVGGEYSEERNRFDHHQVGGAGTRPNGTPYSAFGLIWKKYGLEYCEGNEEVWRRMDQRFVSSFDAYDNGFRTYEMTVDDASVIELQDLFDNLLNPNLAESSDLADFDKAFQGALGIASLILSRAYARKRAEVESEQYFYNLWLESPDKRYVVLDKFATSGEMAEKMPELLYYVFLAPNGTWNVKAMQKSRTDTELKKPFPEQWAGLRDGELAECTGVADAAFCHNARFMCGAHSKEGALALVKLSLAASS